MYIKMYHYTHTLYYMHYSAYSWVENCPLALKATKVVNVG